jgi:hypothetical protein
MKLMFWGITFFSTTYFSIGQEKTILLDGKIDKYPIVMQIDTYDSICTIKYFYLNQLKDILLEGPIDEKEKLKVITDDRGDDKIDKEQFELTKTSSGYAGIWTSGKKKLTVNLKEVSIEKYKNQYEYLHDIKALKNDDKYNYIKTANFNLILDSISTNGNVQLSWYHEKYSGIVMPRIKSGYSPIVLQKINSSLLENHLTESKNSLECASERWGEFNLTSEYIFSDKYMISFNISVGYYCGGAHPDFGSEGLNFDTQTGELLNLDKVFWFGNKKPPVENSSEWYDYRDSVFAPKIVEIFKKIYPAEMKTQQESSDDYYCDYADSEVWNFPNWYFTNKGLYLGAIFGRVARSCDSPEWSVIPYKILKNYLSPQSKLKLPE